MSGSSLPYHLRTNKAIDRRIFFDLLKNISPFLPRKIQEYKYISMGGPMLEDHHILHHELGMAKLESIEKDKAALSRQNFNKPFGCISCLHTDTGSFIRNFNESEPVVVWLDYTAPKWSTQFRECSDLLKSLNSFDILKVTFNANPDVLKKENKSSSQVFKEKANSKFISENIIDNDVISMNSFAETISGIFESIAEDALFGEGLRFHPLTQFRYIDDRHQMLTISGILIDESEEDFGDKLEELMEIARFNYLSQNWGDIKKINVPVLTQKERLEINRLLPELESPIDPDRLPFIFDKNPEKSKEFIQNYIQYYRYIPNFQRLAT